MHFGAHEVLISTCPVFFLLKVNESQLHDFKVISIVFPVLCLYFDLRKLEFDILEMC